MTKLPCPETLDHLNANEPDNSSVGRCRLLDPTRTNAHKSWLENKITDREEIWLN